MNVIGLTITVGLLLFNLGLYIKSRRISQWPYLDSYSAGQTTSSVSVVIAARNEARNIQACLESILHNQTIKEIIVIDDHSSDLTFDIVQRLSADNPILKIYPAPSKPDDWTGKNFALNFGAGKVDNEYILFTDADVVFSEGLVDRSLALTTNQVLDFLSGSFYIRCHSIAEHIGAPVLVLSSAMALFKGDNAGSATGAFMMVRNDCYRRIGGHRTIKDSVIDDVALARRLKSAGARCLFLNFTDHVQVRLFCGAAGFVSLITRTAQSYLEHTVLVPLLGGFGVLCAGLALMIIPLMATGSILLGDSNLVIVLAGLIGTVAYLIGLKTVLSVRFGHNAKTQYGLFYPLAAVLLGFSTLKSALMRLFNLKISWKDRAYSIHKKSVLIRESISYEIDH